MKKIFFTLLCGASIFWGCSDDFDTPGESVLFKEYLIDVYIVPEKIKAQDGYGVVFLSLEGPVCASWSTGADYAEFLRLAALHGGRIDQEIAVDDFYWMGGYGCAYVCYAEDFTSINVTCNQPWDETHPAGSSLNEFCRVSFSTFAPFVRNGNSGLGTYEIYKRADQLADGDLDMIAHGTLDVLLPSKSHYSVRHTFTISLTTESGRTLSAQWNREPTP